MHSPATDIEVSVLCLTYNHEKYIEDALKGFMLQETSFSFEVIIHDDASSDETRSILENYASRYPETITLILQSDNQYSKGVDILKDILVPRSKGRYLAICEGDDYWFDPLKLQKQYDLMEAYDECSFCFANAELIDAESKKSLGTMVKPGGKSYRFPPTTQRLSMDDMVSVGSIPTATYFFTKTAYEKIPKLPEGAFSGDLTYQLFMSHPQGAVYLDDPVAAYRVGVPGSVSSQWRRSPEKSVRANASIILMWEYFDSWTDHHYEEEVRLQINKALYDNAKHLCDRRLLSFQSALLASSSISRLEKIKCVLLYVSPGLFKFVRAVMGS